MRNEGQIRRKPTEPTSAWSVPTHQPEPTAPLSPQPAPQADSAAPLDQQLPTAPAYHFEHASLFPEPSSATPDTPPSDPSGPDTFGGNSRQIAGWLSASFPESGGPTVQASPRVNDPGDQYEQEADRMADIVMRSPAGPDEQASAPDDTPDMPAYDVQRTASGAGLPVTPEVESNISRMQGGGAPLPAGKRSFFEHRFGHDFSQIRIHADEHAARRPSRSTRGPSRSAATSPLTPASTSPAQRAAGSCWPTS